MYVELNMAESTIMDLCGMKTASIFTRYNIRGRKQRRAAGERIAAAYKLPEPDREVVGIGKSS